MVWKGGVLEVRVLEFCGRLMKLCRYFSFGKGSRAALEGARGSMPRHAIKVGTHKHHSTCGFQQVRSSLFDEQAARSAKLFLRHFLRFQRVVRK